MADSDFIGRLRGLIQEMRAIVEDRNAGEPWRDRVREVGASVSALADEIEAARGEPSAGTDAYTMVAAAEQAHVETTETLIHMVAATALVAVLDNGVGSPFANRDGSWSITFSPADMDRMHRDYEMDAKRDGMNTTVTLRLRDHSLPSLAAEPGIDDTPAKPQAAEHVFDRPLWCARVDAELLLCNDRAHATFVVADAQDGETIASVENRYCVHDQCPAEHCNVDNVPPRDTAEK